MAKVLVGVPGFRRGVAVAAGLAATGGLAVSASGAAAAPQPSVAQVQARINQLTSQFDQVSEQLDQAGQQLAVARSRLSQVRLRLDGAQARFAAEQADVAQMAAAAFEDTGATSVAGVLTSGDPSGVLRQGSLLVEESGSRTAESRRLLADAGQLAAAGRVMQRTEAGVAALAAQLGARKHALGGLIAAEKVTLASLTVPQQQAVQSQSIGGNGTSAPQPYTGPVSTRAGQAVAFAYAQLGKPYQWGATGPGSFDCSGLVQAAWAAAGVAIPRNTYDQWGALPHIATSAIQPGDLLFYDGIGHVAMYVGGGYMIDAPQTGLDVEKIPMNTGWYAANFDGAARP